MPIFGVHVAFFRNPLCNGTPDNQQVPGSCESSTKSTTQNNVEKEAKFQERGEHML